MCVMYVCYKLSVKYINEIKNECGNPLSLRVGKKCKLECENC